MAGLSQVGAGADLIHRRQVLKMLGAASLAAPAILSGRSSKADELRVGLIGCGGRGSGAVSQALKVNSSVRLVAMADIDATRMESSLVNLKNALGAQVNVPSDGQFVGLDAYKRVLESNVDMVILATPPGFRPLHFRAAVNAGKHVFLEKPVAVDVAGSLEILEAAKIAQQKNLKCCVGFNRRFMRSYADAIQRIPDLLGSVKSLDVAWLSGGIWVRDRKPDDTEMRYQCTNWYHFTWLSGDYYVEQHSSNLDVVRWVMGGLPLSASGVCRRDEKRGPKYGDGTDDFEVQFAFPGGIQVSSFARQQKGKTNRVNEIVEGSNGVRLTLTNLTNGLKAEKNDQVIWSYKTSKPDPDPYQEEQRQLIEAIYSNKTFNNVAECTESTLIAILGRTAAYERRMVTWDSLLASGQRYFPANGVTSFDEQPPAVPDKFGDYPVPARALV